MGDELGHTQLEKKLLTMSRITHAQKTTTEITKVGDDADQSHGEAIIVDKPKYMNLNSLTLVEVAPRDVQPRQDSNREVVVSNSNLSDNHSNLDNFEIQLNEIDVAIQKFEKSNPSLENLVMHSTNKSFGDFSRKISTYEEFS
nr:hypothetical protein CFP56_38187 [Quercus suber]